MDESLKKRCTWCGEEYLATTEFWYHKKNSKYDFIGALMDRCKNCVDQSHKVKHIRKICSQCSSSFQGNPRTTTRYCPSCYNQYRKERRAKGLDVLSPEVARDRNLRQNYGITAEDYDRMFAQQGGVCAICKQPETKIDPRSKTGAIKHLHVDHDHKTGDVRALLCNNCNTALGLMYEDPKRIRALLTYVKWCKTLDQPKQTEKAEKTGSIIQLSLL
jgi:hypothetical protein